MLAVATVLAAAWPATLQTQVHPPGHSGLSLRLAFQWGLAAVVATPGRQWRPEEGRRMATYVSLIKFTQQGIATIKDGPARLDSGKETLKAFGSELKAFYLTMGRYDVVAISEAPDDEAAAKVALAIGSAGNVTTETLRAFTEDEYRAIVAALP
jgi:uncharacterized protein with GYD domain